MSDSVTHTLPPFFLDSWEDDHSDMYRHLPYTKDIELCPPEMIRLVSGNVVKHYTIQQEEDKVTIDTNNLAEHLVELGKADSLRYHSHIIAKPEDVIDAEDIPASASSTDQAADASALLADRASGKAKKAGTNKTVEKPHTFNSFANVPEDNDDFSFLKK